MSDVQQNEMISVIVPIYNVEDYLACCLDSILAQSYANLEILLVNDGSTDCCRLICEDYCQKDERIQLINQENQGLAAARNTGLNAAAGDWFAFVDSDDWIDQNFLMKLWTACKEYECDLAACGYFKEEDQQFDNEKKYQRTFFSEKEKVMATYLKDKAAIGITACNKLYKSDTFKTLCFKNGKKHEDQFFTYRVLDRAEQMILLDEPLYYYRTRQNSIMWEAAALPNPDEIEALVEQTRFLEESYPHLAHVSKLEVCHCCYNSYQKLFLNKKADAVDVAERKKRIKAFRRKITFSLKEMKLFKLKEQALVLLTAGDLDLFFRLKRNQ